MYAARSNSALPFIFHAGEAPPALITTNAIAPFDPSHLPLQLLPFGTAGGPQKAAPPFVVTDPLM